MTGEPGIGKTRLVETAVAVSGARVRWGRCTDVGGAPAWWPWLQVLGAVPDAGSGFAVGLAVVRELAALAADRPLLVVLDDVQWADADSRQALEVVLTTPLPPGMLLVLLCREEATPSRPPPGCWPWPRAPRGRSGCGSPG